MAGLTVGSLSPVKANALTAGGNQTADLLTSARQNSLARHAFTAVIIKSTGEARYSAFCLLELTRNDDGAFSEWKMTAPWRVLPEGIRFDPRAVAARQISSTRAAGLQLHCRFPPQFNFEEAPSL